MRFIKLVMFDPLNKIVAWVKEADDLGIKDPHAAILSTVNSDSQVSSRVVLCRCVENKGINFFTNYGSRKAQDMAVNNKVSLCFFWRELDKQIRVEGSVNKLKEKDSDEYFKNRKRGSQIGAWASKQSKDLSNYNVLIDKVQEYEDKFVNRDVQRPDFWGGYSLRYNRVEFWEAGEFRLHKRELCERDGKVWSVKNLYP